MPLGERHRRRRDVAGEHETVDARLVQFERVGRVGRSLGSRCRGRRDVGHAVVLGRQLKGLQKRRPVDAAVERGGGHVRAAGGMEQLKRSRRLHHVVRDQPQQRVIRGRVELHRLALDCDRRQAVGQPRVSASWRDLHDPGLVEDRQRQLGRGGVEIADVGDRVRVVRCHLCVAHGQAGASQPARSRASSSNLYLML